MERVVSVILAGCLMAAAPAAAKVVTIDFDELGFDDDVYCGKRDNVNYCDDNKYLYSHIGDYLLLSDYDFSADTDITADPGTYFTPISFEVSAFSQVWRLYCPECVDDSVADEAVYVREDEFEVYDYDYMTITGFRDGARVASQSLDPTSLSMVTLDAGFADIDRLNLALNGAYFESYALEEDGYLYTCILNMYSYCNEATVDNLVVDTAAPLAPVPAGGSGLALAGALAMLGGSARRRRARPAA